MGKIGFIEHSRKALFTRCLGNTDSGQVMTFLLQYLLQIGFVSCINLYFSSAMPLCWASLFSVQPLYPRRSLSFSLLIPPFQHQPHSLSFPYSLGFFQRTVTSILACWATLTQFFLLSCWHLTLGHNRFVSASPYCSVISRTPVKHLHPWLWLLKLHVQLTIKTPPVHQPMTPSLNQLRFPVSINCISSSNLSVSPHFIHCICQPVCFFLHPPAPIPVQTSLCSA